MKTRLYGTVTIEVWDTDEGYRYVVCGKDYECGPDHGFNGTDSELVEDWKSYVQSRIRSIQNVSIISKEILIESRKEG